MRIKTTLCAAAVSISALSGGCGAGHHYATPAAPAVAQTAGASDAELESAYTALAKAQVRGASAAEVAALQARVKELEARRTVAGAGGGATSGVTATGVAPAAGGGVTVVPGAELPYFRAGGNTIQAIVPPPPPEPPPPTVGSLVVRISDASIIDEDVSALMTEVLGYIGGGSAGFVMGYSRIGDVLDGVVLGGSFFRYDDAVSLFQVGSVSVWLSMPAIDTVVGFYFPSGDDSDVRLRLSAGIETLGIRVASCLGSMSVVAEVRGPRVGVSMFGRTEEDPKPMLELGGSASVGVTW
jgi:hypothetical protein